MASLFEDSSSEASLSAAPPSAPVKMITVSNAKIDVEKFDGQNNFGLWQSEVMDSLYQQDLDIVLEEEKPEDVFEKDWVRLNVKACGMIRSCLCREQKYPFMKETSANKLWKALENKYMKRSNENRLYLMKRLFRL